MKSYQQEMDHTCGAVCVRDIQAWAGLRVENERGLARKLRATVKEGIEPYQIEQYLRGLGLKAEYVEGEKFSVLRRRLEAGWLPIVIYADWGGHYVIIKDIIKAGGWSGGRMVLLDPAAMYEARPDGFTDISVDRFKSLWFCPIAGHKQEVIYVRKGNEL